MAPIQLRLRDGALVVPPFRLRKHGQTYASRAELLLELGALRPGAYRLVAVQNFHVEDSSPRLEECAAGVFLARRRADGRWEEPERFPVECRTLALLGYVEVGPVPRVAPAA
ncbi:MAG TPA: hypothetical protein VD704_11905 [Gaiellaceae bacterium]|nr:hypothetical protein [Gaiellaceae bacterium]